MMSFKRILQVAKPWLLCIAVFLFLRYTGLFSAVSSGAQSAIMQTGALDATAEETGGGKDFNYNFSLVDLDRKTLDMQSLRGKTLFINVWATWCGPCRVEMPSIQNLYESVGDDVAFIMLSVDQKDPQAKVKSYISDKGYTFPVYLPAGALPEQLQVRSIPATFVVNKEGKIVFRQMGTANYDTDEFRKFLKGL